MVIFAVYLYTVCMSTELNDRGGGSLPPLYLTKMECKDNKCKRRDNEFGITWCINCGRLFTKPCGVIISDEERNLNNNRLFNKITERFNKTFKQLKDGSI